MMRGRPIIVVLTKAYRPGFKSGGPIKSILNLVECLGDEFDFRIITRDRETGDATAYPGVVSHRWARVGKAQVYYAERLNIPLLRRLVADLDYDAIYLNSFFSWRFTIQLLLLRRLGRIRRAGCILAPRGELSRAALRIKAPKKRIYLAIARSARLYSGLSWQASSEHELADLRAAARRFGAAGRPLDVFVASDLTATTDLHGLASRPVKETGKLRVVFLSRIARIKNLHLAIELIGNAVGQVHLDIYGPMEDRGYWSECEARIAELGPGATARYCGAVPADDVIGTLGRYELFLLPTGGENFGHVIFEALLAGCMVLISDRTPWRNLESSGIGWDLPLRAHDAFQAAIAACVAMGESELAERSRKCREFALGYAGQRRAIASNRSMLESASRSLAREGRQGRPVRP